MVTMRDVRLFIFDKEAAEKEAIRTGQDPVWWTFDIALADGDFVFVPNEENNMDQRAAITAFVVVGSIYGDKEYGIDWSPYLSNDTGLINIDNQIKKNIQQNAMPDLANGIGSMYGVQYIPKDGNMGIRIIRGNNNVRT